jgi:hypothetical protein
VPILVAEPNAKNVKTTQALGHAVSSTLKLGSSSQKNATTRDMTTRLKPQQDQTTTRLNNNNKQEHQQQQKDQKPTTRVDTCS